MFCKHCGKEIGEAAWCPYCGAQVNPINNQPQAQPQPQAQQDPWGDPAPTAPMTSAPQTNTLALVGLILSIVFGGLISLIVSIIGLNKAKELNSGKGMAIAGIIISVAKIVISIIVVIIYVALFASGILSGAIALN